jgi:hypothetical protein
MQQHTEDLQSQSPQSSQVKTLIVDVEAEAEAEAGTGTGTETETKAEEEGERMTRLINHPSMNPMN